MTKKINKRNHKISEKNLTNSENLDNEFTEKKPNQAPSNSSVFNELQELRKTLNETKEELKKSIYELENCYQKSAENLTEDNEDFNEENLLSNLSISTIFLDRDLNIKKFTPSISDHFQLNNNDIGSPIDLFSGTVNGKEITKKAKRVLKTLQPCKKEVKNEKGLWFSMKISPFTTLKHEIKGIVINFINIDESKKIIKEKDKANSFLAHLTKSTPAITYLFDIQKKQNIYTSGNISKMTGYSPEELKEMGNAIIPTIMHPDDVQFMFNQIRKISKASDDEVLQYQCRLITKTKKTLWVITSDRVYERDEEGNVKTTLGIALVINDLKNIESELKRNEERYRLAFAGTGSALWEWTNLSENKAWWSPELHDILGYTKKELKPDFSSLVNLIHPEQINIFRKGLEKHVEKEAPFEEEVLIKTKSEGYKWFRVNGQMQTDEYNEAKKIVGSLLDIDERKKSETRLKDLNVELERFAYLASHDLKEPLNTITSFTSLLKEDYVNKLDENANIYMDFIQKASIRMTDLTNDLLQYSQLNNKSLQLEKNDLNDLVKEVQEDLLSTISKTNAEIIIVKKLPQVHCDRIQIKQLFQNLISNSLKYKSDKNPIIKIDFSEKISYFEIKCSDNGIGIDPKYQNQIFEVFKRLHKKEEYEGTGIGLANCKRIVDNHGGHIWVESQKNIGSDFMFTIPKIT